MSNTILTPTIIAKEALIQLYANMVSAALIHSDYSEEFGKEHNGYKIGDTVTIRKPATFVSNVWNGSTVSVQNITESSTSVTLDTVRDVTFTIAAKEWELKISEFSERVIQPAMMAHAQAIDEMVLGLYKDVPYYQAVSGTPAASDLLAVRAQLNDRKVPMDRRYGIFDPMTEPKYVGLDAFLHAEKRGDTKAQKEGSLGRTFGIDWFMDQNVVTHVKGTVTDSVTVERGTSDTTKLKLTETGKTVKDGDILNVKSTEIIAAGFTNGIDYVILEDKSINTATEVSVYPPVAYAMSSSDGTVVDTGGPNNLVFHRNAFAIVSRPLEKPKSAGLAEVVSYKGLSARLTGAWDKDTKAETLSLDILLGVKTLMPELAVRLID